MWTSTLNEKRKLTVPAGVRMFRRWQRGADMAGLWFARVRPVQIGGLGAGVALFEQHVEARTTLDLPKPFGLLQIGCSQPVEHLPTPPDWLLPIPGCYLRDAAWGPHTAISWLWLGDGFLLLAETDLIAAHRAGWSAFAGAVRLAPTTPALRAETLDAFRWLKRKREERQAGPRPAMWEGLNPEINPAPLIEELDYQTLLYGVQAALARKR